MPKKKPAASVRRDLASTPTPESPTDFLLGGRAELGDPRAQQQPKVGRPPLDEEIKRAEIGLRLEDSKAIELLGIQWSIATGSKTSLKVTPVVRSVIALVVPLLQNLEVPPRDEDHLRELLAEAFEKGFETS